MNDRERLEAIVKVVRQYLPPDGICIREAMGKIIELVDPLPPKEEEKGLQLQIAERERTAVIETIDELMGMESDRHPMFSEGYDHALDHIKQFVQGRRT
jgi:hypothetical protein